MPWKEQTVEEMRREFVQAAMSGKQSLSRLCREYGISRPTAYKWLARAAENESMADRSRAPHTIASKTPAHVEQAIVTIRADNPAWGGKTIRQVMANNGCKNLPCIKTFQNILKRNGCISPEESLKHTAFTRFEKEHCNEMWQTDFKGDFALGDGSRCYPLTILDDHSRYSISIHTKPNTLGVKDSFRRVFEEYGKPDTILSDKGAQFAGFRQGYTQFEKWLMEQDVLPIHGQIRHPQTQGKIERFHRTMNQELLRHRSFADLQEADAALQTWRVKYNSVRPHEAIGMKCPAQVYLPSPRVYQDCVSHFEYGGQFHVIKVNSWGYVRFDKFQIYLSQTMAGEHVEFRHDVACDSFSVCFRNFKIAAFDSLSGLRLHRRISRL